MFGERRAGRAVGGALVRPAVGLEAQLERLAEADAQQRGRGERADGDAVARVAVAGEPRLELETAGADHVAGFDEVGAVGGDGVVAGVRERRAGEGRGAGCEAELGHAMPWIGVGSTTSCRQAEAFLRFACRSKWT